MKGMADMCLDNTVVPLNGGCTAENVHFRKLTSENMCAQKTHKKNVWACIQSHLYVSSLTEDVHCPLTNLQLLLFVIPIIPCIM